MNAFNRRTRNPTREEVKSLPIRKQGDRLQVSFLLGFSFPSEVSSKQQHKKCDLFFLLQVTKIDIQPQFDLAGVVGDALDRQVSVIKYID